MIFSRYTIEMQKTRWSLWWFLFPRRSYKWKCLDVFQIQKTSNSSYHFVHSTFQINSLLLKGFWSFLLSHWENAENWNKQFLRAPDLFFIYYKHCLLFMFITKIFKHFWYPLPVSVYQWPFGKYLWHYLLYLFCIFH